ncbi:AraC family transcriptional regulator ligand-binding domain-containing protein [Paenibacillus sp. MMS20-IR301]|uniref:AraC family transcriptional regulator n=1 Tax=Paenibacillus sp. MMS20-IR301 TaxID=2895946 RepID=UPI0028F0F328|nr:AraC family transcriptional regulator ligand-binding domain-containing protein [Paenibacillus sp. MMS20-IR301]WNS45512.1 AraC family transcriptional regulator ligand-binding domain-containing protein [Paenibacillus sp. MMS20-IR301]
MSTYSMDRIKIPQGFWEGLHQLGLAPHDIARKAGLPLTVISEPTVNTAQYYAIWQAYSELSGDVARGMIRLATTYEATQYPPTVLATYHARDYRDALHRMARYKQLCPPENMTINEDGGACMIELKWLAADQACPPLLVGITLAFLLELGRRGTGRHLKASLVEFAQPMGDVQALEAYFGCRVRTDSGRNCLTLDRKDLDLPFLTYNEELLEILSPALERTLNHHQGNRSVSGMVKWIMKCSFSAGRPDVQSVAKELGMSDRTLQRRLSEENTSFIHLLTQARHEQARMYLADLSLDIKDVAFLIGYEDQNSFYRAFRAWEGDTPANWRSAHAEGYAGLEDTDQDRLNIH